MKNNTFHDVEQVSAYLDGKLSQADSARLESRLKSDPSLRAIKDDLSETRSLLRKLPVRRAPRNFTLTPKMAGVKPPLPRAYPALRLATSLATLLLIFTFATNAFLPAIRGSVGRGMGGGGGGCDACGGGAPGPLVEMAPAATMAPATEAPSADANIQPTVEPYATLDQSEKNIAPESSPTSPEQPVWDYGFPLSWQIGLFVVALASGGMAWILRLTSDSSWRGKSK